MATQDQELVAFASGAVSLVNAVETVGITTRALSSPFAGCTFSIFFTCFISTGVGSTSISVQVRRTSLTGTSVYGPTVVTHVASTLQCYTIGLTDAPAGDVSGLLWVATFNVTGGAAAGSLTNAYSSVLVSS